MEEEGRPMIPPIGPMFIGRGVGEAMDEGGAIGDTPLVRGGGGPMGAFERLSTGET